MKSISHDRTGGAPFRDASGVSTVEFALILPSILIILGMTLMGGEGFAIDRKVTLAARTVTDLVTRAPYVYDPGAPGATQLARSDLDVDLALGAQILFPYSQSSLQIVVSELAVNAAKDTGTIVWSEGYNGASPLAKGTVLPLDPTMVSTGAPYLIVGEVSYTFQPLGVIMPLGPITFTQTQTMLPRSASRIDIVDD